MAKKKPTKKKLPVFKYIVRRKQKRKDKKTVYYYYNYTDKKITSEKKYNAGLELRKKFKEVYGKDWLKKIKSGITQIKKVEKEQKIFDRKQIQKLIEAYQKKTGFPVSPFMQPINFSAEMECTDKVINNQFFLLQYNGRFYIVPKDRLIDLTLFFFYVIDTFFSYLRNHYKSETISKKTKKGFSPFILWCIDWIINESEYPELFSLNLDKAISSEGFISASNMFKSFLRQGFNEYIFDLPPIENVYEFIYSLRKKK